MAELFDEQTGRWFIVKASAVHWVDGSPAQALSTTDVTARHEAEQQLARQVKASEQSARLITMGEATSSIAHEINQPLAAAQNYANAALSRLQAGRLTEEDAVTAFTKIVTQTNRAAQVIRRIRSYARRSDSQIVTVAPAQLVDEAMELAQIIASDLHMQIVIEMDENLPPVACDGVLIVQVILNLLKNAMEASSGAVDRRVTLHVFEEGNRVRFRVSDHGPGVPDELKNRLFEAFFTTKPTGVGIGLNICRSIIESYEGRLIYSDNEGGGAVFTFGLPKAKDAVQS